jgi:enamine deaminase RidA (YjgF/YER057c/UK114 family)
MQGVKPGTTKLVPGGIEAKTKQTLKNFKAMLEPWGLGLDDVVRTTACLDDKDKWPAMNKVYVKYFIYPKLQARHRRQALAGPPPLVFYDGKQIPLTPHLL